TTAAGDTNGKAQVGDTAGVTLSLDKTTYDPGAAVVMSISSQRADTLGYNSCSDRSVERETPSGWVVHPEPNRMCTMELRLLLPSETQTAQTDLPADLDAGTYRIVLRLRQERSDTTPERVTVGAASAPFHVPAS
ncbi:MAG: immunoglobulin-like domain-containing protein, partial [Gemmatimonadaceae bacterium]